MEHSCVKCGASVVDGLPFCPQCKSPQIRVPGLEVEQQSGDMPGPGERYATGRQFPTILPSNAVLWHQALPSAVMGGLLSIAALFVPLAALGPAYALGGAAAVFMYRLRVRSTHLSTASGAKIGAASGGFGFSIVAIIIIGTYVYHADDLRRLLGDLINQAAAHGSDPQAVQQALELLRTQEGLGAFVAFLLAILLFMFVLASSVGGALCASWLRRR